MPLVSVGDVERLMRDPSGAVRAETAEKLARAYTAGAFSAAELDEAVQIFRLMVKDAESRVREALAFHLNSNPLVPHDVAVALARDIDAVALPMLARSPVLRAADLVDIIVTQRNLTKMRAIAARAQVETAVVKALIAHGDEIVVTTVAANPGAEFETDAYALAIDRFGGSEAVQTRLIDRADLPPAVAERLVALVADHLKGRLRTRATLSEGASAAIVLATRERATLSLARDFSDAGVGALIAQLRQNHRLTGSIVLRAICMGQTRFFVQALASLCGGGAGAVQQQLREPMGLETLWRQAKLPARLLPAARAAYDTMHAAESAADLAAADLASAVARAIRHAYRDAPVSLPRADLEDLQVRLNQYAIAEPAGS